MLPIGDATLVARSTAVSGSYEPRADENAQRTNYLYARRGTEPAIEEMLSDPVVLAMMTRDGVTVREVRSMIASLRRRLAVTREPRRGEFEWRAAANL
jgi:hypothetical protein